MSVLLDKRQQTFFCKTVEIQSFGCRHARLPLGSQYVCSLLRRPQSSQLVVSRAATTHSLARYATSAPLSTSGVSSGLIRECHSRAAKHQLDETQSPTVSLGSRSCTAPRARSLQQRFRPLACCALRFRFRHSARLSNVSSSSLGTALSFCFWFLRKVQATRNSLRESSSCEQSHCPLVPRTLGKASFSRGASAWSRIVATRTVSLILSPLATL